MRGAARGTRIFLSLFSVFLFSCSEDGSEATESAGPVGWTASSEPQTTIGQIEGDVEYLFSGIRAAILLPDGGIAVADRDAEGIRLFSSTGHFRREIGRRGEGPGEIGRIATLSVVPPDTLVAHDSDLYRLTRYSTSGSLLSVQQLRPVDGFPEIFLGEYSTGELGFGWIRQGLPQEYELRTDLMQLARFNQTGELTHNLGTHPGMIRSGSSPLAFSPHLYATLIGDSVFITDGLLPEVQVWDDQGVLVRTIHVPVPEVDAGEAWAALENYIQEEGDEFQNQWMEGQPREAPIPRVSKMIVDDRNRLWLKRYESPGDSHLVRGRCRGGKWMVMETSGEVVASVHLPDELFLLDVRGNQLLGQTRDELGVERVHVFEIVESR